STTRKEIEVVQDSMVIVWWSSRGLPRRGLAATVISGPSVTIASRWNWPKSMPSRVGATGFEPRFAAPASQLIGASQDLFDEEEKNGSASCRDGKSLV